MAVFTIDGTLEEAVVKRNFARVTQYEKLRFRCADGKERLLGKTVADRSLVDELQPGTKGRFYLFKVVDHQGVCGVRTASGAAAFALVKGPENAMLISTAVGLVAILLSFLLRTWLTSWAVICLLIGIPFYLIYSSTRREAERRFAADADLRF